MFGICLGLLGVFMHFAHPQHGGPIWWGMVTQIGAVLAAILPAFVMARIEKRLSARSACSQKCLPP